MMPFPEQVFPVCFSMGLVSFTVAPTDDATALYAADALLYDAKRRGKNLISTSKQKWGFTFEGGANVLLRND